jgi:UDP-N-acetylglucosamine 3-dehydrogenase
MVKLGIMGMGYIGRIHLEASHKLNNARVLAVASLRSEQVRQAYSGLEVYSNYEDLLSDDRLDAIIICLPTFLHEQYVVKAAQCGRHILCEKPFALDVASAGRMLEAANRRGIILMIAQVLRFWPQYVRIKELLTAGAIGSIYSVSAHRLASYPSWGKWFRDPEKSGGCLLDLQVHDVDFTYWILGPPQAVHTTGIRSATGSWDHVFTSLIYSEAVASIESSYLMPDSWPFTAGVRINGSLACLEYNFRVFGNIQERNQAHAECNTLNALLLYSSDGSARMLDVTAEDGFVSQLRYFVSCIEQRERPAICPPEQSYQVMRVMDACRQSAESHQIIKFKADH